MKPNGAKLWRYRFSREGKAQKLSLDSLPRHTHASDRYTEKATSYL
ncbi:hypothetical protein [Obesumbacterium proteus]